MTNETKQAIREWFNILGAIVICILLVAWLTGCVTEPNPTPPPEEINVVAENAALDAESVQAVESALICGTWTLKHLVARPVVNALNVIPFFSGIPQPCPE